MTIKSRVINDIIDREGGYNNDPSDSGGETNWGITEHVARENGYKGVMRDMPKFVAYRIYERAFWYPLRLDDIEGISDEVAAEVADTGANMGVYRSAEFLQRSLNVLNHNGADYPDLRVDGQIGPRTIAALRRFVDLREYDGVIVLVKMLNALQGAFYVNLAERRQKDEKFVYGWFMNRVA